MSHQTDRPSGATDPQAAEFEHGRRLAGVFHASPINDDGRTDISVQDGSSTLTFRADEALFHAGGAVHGAHLFKLLDDAAFFAANSVVPDVFVLTVSFTVQFMRPATTEVLTATGKVVRATRRVVWAESEVRTEKGALVGTGSGTFLRSEIPLDEKIGYR